MFKRLLWIVTLGITLLASLANAKPNEYYFRFTIDSKVEILKLTKIISIDNVKGDTVYAYANESEMNRFQGLGYSYEILPAPSTLFQPRMTDDKDLVLDWDYYPTYSAYLTLMYAFEDDYPSLCEMHNIGYTVQGRRLLFAKISANVSVEESEPELMYSSTIHGDETTGYILMLHLIDYLLSNYGVDPDITYLLDHTEIWINPNANPDGTYAGGNNTVWDATRSNANGIDMNRNFPDPADGQHPDGHAWQPETVAMLDFFGQHNFVISANLHGGAEVVNYPWDTWSRLHPDDNWWVSVSREFADSAQANSPSGYMTDENNGITNGYAWYRITGGRQDCLNYWYGCREVTLELSHTKTPAENQLQNYWNYNRGALLTYLEQAYYGIRGSVTDANTGFPVGATISVIDHDRDSSEVYSDPDHGDYYRMIEPGTYSIRFTAPGYVPFTANNVTATYRNTTQLDVQLTPLSTDPDLEFVSQNAGVVNAGDQISMAITLANNGGGNATGVQGVLSTTDPYISITQNTSAYPTINALGGMGTSSINYVFDVSPSCPIAHTATFRLNMTADGGYSDSLFFTITIGLQIEDFETGNFANFNWQQSGNANWTIVSTGAYEGTYSAKSGVISHNQSSVLYINYEVFEQDSISFYCKVSSEATYDSLRFFIDSSLKQGWSGSLNWSRAVFPVSPGVHTFKWEYMKDGSESEGSDCAWIDYIIFPSSSQALQITTQSLPNWTVGHAYSQQLIAEGGEGAKTWSDLNNNLNGTGLSLSTSGLLSGTPTTAGQISFTAHVQDDGGNSDDQPFTFTINPALIITTESLPSWTAGYAYSQQFIATGGTGSKTWLDVNGDLVGTGLTLSSSGLLAGTPTAAGLISLSARVTDAVGASTDHQFEFVINAALEISTVSMLDWTRGRPYSQQLEATGGTGELLWSDLHDNLDDFGLTISDAGLVVGLPNTIGQVVFTARVIDDIGATTDTEFHFTINPVVHITTETLPEAVISQPYSYQLDATGGTGTLIWSDRDDDLSGIDFTLSPDGVLSGTSHSAIAITFVAVATDEVGAKDEQWLTITFEASFVPGDANGDGRVIGSDVTYLVAYFRGINPPPTPFFAGDANGDCQIIGSDVTYLVAYFRGIGAPPVMGDCPPTVIKIGR